MARRKKNALHNQFPAEHNDNRISSNDDDCDIVPPTIILNQDLIVDYKYAYFHHDDEDVQQNFASFVIGDNLEPNVLCAGDECQTSN